MRSRRLWLAGFAVLLLLGGFWRLRQTAEYLALRGTPKERVDLCRALPYLSEARRTWILRRFLHDPSEDLCSAAITAYGRVAPEPTLEAILVAALRLEDSSPVLRTKAGTILLSRQPVDSTVLTYVREQAAREAFRRACPRLVAGLAALELPDLNPAEREQILRQSMEERDPAHAELQVVVRDHVDLFKSQRSLFLQRLQQPSTFRTRQFLVGALAEIDGAMRGQTAEDWLQPELEAAGEDAFHAVEAEWATEIRPNYQIATWGGRRCLFLGEGAGGFMSWLKGHDGTVDIGTARLSLYAPQAGAYRVWACVYMDDKCGNSFGFWMDGRQFANFSDRGNVLREWCWLPLKAGGQEAVPLTQGHHRVRLEAWEDGVYIDRFALLPASETPAHLPAKAASRWDPGLAPSISFSPEWQAQPRGTTQLIVVWVRRHKPTLRLGKLSLHVPQAFEIRGVAQVDLRFEAGNPLARSSFYVHLPETAVSGEGLVQAVYEDQGGARIEGQMILGAQFDWLTTGPLDPGSPLHHKLQRVAEVGRQKYVKSDWKPYPLKGYDTYRRLTPEAAYGQLQNKYIYLCADIQVSKGGRYLGLLTADDWARIYMDDQLIIQQPRSGPGEGRLVQQRISMPAGQHRLFVQLFQAAFHDPTGPDAGRHSANHCNFKLLLRQDRYEPAPAIQGLPHPLR